MRSAAAEALRLLSKATCLLEEAATMSGPDSDYRALAARFAAFDDSCSFFRMMCAEDSDEEPLEDEA